VFKREEEMKEAVLKAAIEWFGSLRPQDYHLQRHYANPLVNTKTDEEGALAEAVGRFLRERHLNLRDHEL